MDKNHDKDTRNNNCYGYQDYSGNNKMKNLFGQHYPNNLNISKLIDIKEYTNIEDVLFIEDGSLMVMPFKIKFFSQYYINPKKIIIDLYRWSSGKFRVSIVHNFQVEDCNPNLNQCLAGIFLGHYYEGYWGIPEDYPSESRTIKVLGCLHIEKNNHVYFEYKRD